VQRRKGFTLIELLVVIAIIAILAAILFPVFARAREKARQSACLSNCKQIGTGLMMYVQDYDETYPGRWTGWYDPPVTPIRAYVSWRVLIQPYVKNVQVFACPSNPVSRGSLAADLYDRYLNPPIPAGYACNSSHGVTGSVGPMPSGTGVALGAVERPAELIFFGENGTWRYEIYIAGYNPANANAIPEVYGGHSGMGNYIFGDGHAKAMKPTATGRPINMWGLNKQNEPAPDALMVHLQNAENYWNRR
jgi:prepilin-type N-terminal cleavage/methylation domain-containing protein/prepilin-type processing-associated H-X9-DG protein